jgi:hypothetical protein
VKSLGREADQLSSEAENKWSYTSIPSVIFIAVVLTYPQLQLRLSHLALSYVLYRFPMI